jgi:uncharacterized protein (TIGR00251 family)
VSGVYTVSGGLIQLRVKVTPGASKTAAAGIAEDRLRFTVAAAPEDGKANAALCAYLAKILGCAKRDAVVTAGEKSRLKTISLPAAFAQKLDAIIEEISKKG